MAAEPLSITTAIITLLKTSQQVISLLKKFAQAEKRVAQIKKDCELTQSVLLYLQEQLDAKAPPTQKLRDANGHVGRPNAKEHLKNSAREHVEQLNIETNDLVRKLEALTGPGWRETRIGVLVTNGQVALNGSYLDATLRNIKSKRGDLLQIANLLNS